MTDKKARRREPPVEIDDRFLSKAIAIVRPIAERHSTDSDHADDLVQECILHVTKYLHRYKPEKGAIEAWIAVVARNLCNSLRRAKGPERCRLSDVAGEIPDPAPLPDQRLEDRRRRTVLDRALARLPRRERRAIELFHLDGRTQREVAEQLGVGVAAVRHAIDRGLGRLKGMADLASSPEARAPASTAGNPRPRTGRPVVLALEPKGAGRDRIRAGARYGELHRLLHGVRFANDRRELCAYARRMDGLPIVVNPDYPEGARSDAGDLTTALRRQLPSVPLIGYVDPSGRWCTQYMHGEKTIFRSLLRRGVDDEPQRFRAAFLEVADHRGLRRVLSDLKRCAPQSTHEFLNALIYCSLGRPAVSELSRRLGKSPSTLTRTCRRLGWSPPKHLLSLAAILHVERLARWSGRQRGPVALAIGFSDPANYRRLVKHTLKMTPGEIGLHGG